MEHVNQNQLTAVSEIQVSYRPEFKASARPKIGSSKDAFRVLKEQYPELIEYQEEFKILIMNRANRVLGIFDVSKGGVAGTIADPKVVFAVALKCNASSIILAHNHPSGNLEPSHADISLTKKIKEAGKLLDIEVSDHIILTADSYTSFADEGLILSFIY